MASFYLLSYEGPNVPWQRVVKTNDSGKSEVSSHFQIQVF